MPVPSLKTAIEILRDFDVESDSTSELRRAASIVLANNIRPKDIMIAIDLIEDEDYDEAEEHIDKAIEDLEEIYKKRGY
jgi:uncharacterized protein (DUF2225 family)